VAGEASQASAMHLSLNGNKKYPKANTTSVPHYKIWFSKDSACNFSHVLVNIRGRSLSGWSYLGKSTN